MLFIGTFFFIFACGKSLSVGFITVWKLALLTLTMVPLIALFGAVHTITLTKLSSKSQDAYSKAGNIAEQVLNCLI